MSRVYRENRQLEYRNQNELPKNISLLCMRSFVLRLNPPFLPGQLFHKVQNVSNLRAYLSRSAQGSVFSTSRGHRFQSSNRSWHAAKFYAPRNHPRRLKALKTALSRYSALAHLLPPAFALSLGKVLTKPSAFVMLGGLRFQVLI